MKRILAMLLSVICVLSFTCVSTYADEKSEDEEKAASIAESYLSAAAKNMWLYESNNLAEHTIQELVDTSGNSLLSDMSTDVNTQKILSSIFIYRYLYPIHVPLFTVRSILLHRKGELYYGCCRLVLLRWKFCLLLDEGL